MKFIHSLIVLLTVASSPTLFCAERTPAIGPCTISSASPRRLECSAAIREALEQYDSAFAFYAEADYLPSIGKSFRWTQSLAPFAAINDFNGDGVFDVVIDGHSRQRRRFIAVQSSRDGYEVETLESSDVVYDPKKDFYDEERGKWIFIARIVPPGRVTPLADDPPFELQFPGIEIEYWGKASEVFFWNGKRWGSYTSGD